MATFRSLVDTLLLSVGDLPGVGWDSISAQRAKYSIVRGLSLTDQLYRWPHLQVSEAGTWVNGSTITLSPFYEVVHVYNVRLNCELHYVRDVNPYEFTKPEVEAPSWFTYNGSTGIRIQPTLAANRPDILVGLHIKRQLPSVELDVVDMPSEYEQIILYWAEANMHRIHTTDQAQERSAQNNYDIALQTLRNRLANKPTRFV